MINPISNSEYIDIINHSYTIYNPAAPNTGREVDGDLRLSNGNLEVYSAGAWTMIGDSSFEVALTHRGNTVLQWAEQKMHEEQKLEELCKKYPSLKEAKDKYEMIKALVEND